MAPISEADVPKKYTGAAMSLGSFMGYVPDLFAYGINGAIIDANKPVAAYTKIFLIGGVVTLIGIVTAGIMMANNWQKDKERHLAAKAAKQQRS
jgi:pantothenate kinase-related protein Tda10